MARLHQQIRFYISFAFVNTIGYKQTNKLSSDELYLSHTQLYRV